MVRNLAGRECLAAVSFAGTTDELSFTCTCIFCDSKSTHALCSFSLSARCIRLTALMLRCCDFTLTYHSCVVILSSPNRHAADGSHGETDVITDADGDVFRVSLAAKLIMLGTLKFATLDPLGMGVEMEGGKPGWNGE